MDFCPSLTNTTIPTTNTQWGQLTATSARNLIGRSYLRPDKGGALLPWVYTLVVLIAHLPTVVLRVVKWEAAQTWCLAASLLTVVVYAQAYVSTRLSADKVLVWTPLLLVIDAGAMAQIVFLICEDRRVLIRAVRNIRASTWYARATDISARVHIRLPEPKSGQPVAEAIPLQEELPPQNNGQAPVPPPSPPLPMHRDSAIYVAFVAALLLIAVVILQIIGLVGAVRADQGDRPLPVLWCSPIFQPFGVAVRDGNCRVFPVDQSFSKGVGCIELEGTIQKGWIKGTVWGTAISLIFEAFDLCILTFVHSNSRPRGVQMNRPWFSMFGGLAVLLVTFIFGIIYASTLPPGITEKVWVVVNIDRPTVWTGTLINSGLRGAMIGWNDGLFEAWENVYFGAWGK